MLRGKWCYEIADLSNIRKAEVEQVKAFASRTHDRARPAYGRARLDLPRRCVIWATTNNAKYLKSQSGNRRFWPVPVKVIDIEALKRDRDQLFAEAVVLDDEGMPIVLPADLWSAAAEEQEKRREADPWEDILRDVRGQLVGDECRVFTHELLETIIGVPKGQRTPALLHRVGTCMRQLGWDGQRLYAEIAIMVRRNPAKSALPASPKGLGEEEFRLIEEENFQSDTAALREHSQSVPLFVEPSSNACCGGCGGCTATQGVSQNYAGRFGLNSWKS